MFAFFPLHFSCLIRFSIVPLSIGSENEREIWLDLVAQRHMVVCGTARSQICRLSHCALAQQEAREKISEIHWHCIRFIIHMQISPAKK